jgi:hypothetical protein
VELVKLKGDSMSPYLRDADLFWLGERGANLDSLQPGAIVLCESPEEKLIHRVLADRRVKGDRNHDADEVVRVLGAIRGRIVAGASPCFIPYDRPALRALHGLQARLSALNEGPGRVVPRLARWSLAVLSRAGRKLENWFFAEKLSVAETVGPKG